jgi:putative Mg2+ transporter-C (MgtC) family protein
MDRNNSFFQVGYLNIDDAQARVIQGIITGIGFKGGGAVLTDKDKIKVTASTASIWNTGGMGLAVAYERIEILVVLSLVNF